jgi:hypothetical protein
VKGFHSPRHGFVTPQASITNSGVGYGVLLNRVAGPTQRLSIDEMTVQLIQHIQQSDELSN